MATTLVIGCGALARELVALIRPLPMVDVACLPATLHNRPNGIPGAVRDRIRRARGDGYARIFVAYADCGTGGLLDRVVEEEGVERLPGAHCYEVYAGRAAFAQLQDEEPGTFYLTDFLVRQFETLVWRGLGLDRHPELLPAYFANYRRVVYLAQTDDPALTAAARRAADRLGLAFERQLTGFGELAAAIGEVGVAAQSTTAPGAAAESAHADGVARAAGPVLPPSQRIGGKRPVRARGGAVPARFVDSAATRARGGAVPARFVDSAATPPRGGAVPARFVDSAATPARGGAVPARFVDSAATPASIGARRPGARPRVVDSAATAAWAEGRRPATQARAI